MNYQDVLHFMFSHSEMLIGIFTALLLFTAIFVLVLPGSGEKNSADLSAIEDALKKVIDKIPQQTQNFGAGGPTTSSANILDEEDGYPKSNQEPEKKVAGAAPPQVEAMKAQVLEREKKITNLEAELGQIKAQLTKTPIASGLPDPEMQAKLTELQNKLSEYAIIEEELADISRFKEENAKMRAQIEALQAGGPAPTIEAPAISAVTPAPAISAAPAAVEPVAMNQNLIEDDQVLNDFQAAVETQSAPKDALASEMVTAIPVPDFPSSEISEPEKLATPEGDAFELAMTEPASPEESAIVASEASPESLTPAASPLEGQLDTSKMLEEMQNLDENSEAEEVDPMAGLLDTEKLLAEVRELGGPKSSSTGAPAPSGSHSEVDDLMGEFEAEQQQVKAKA